MDLEQFIDQPETELIVGFFDLRGFDRWCDGRPPREVLETARALINRAGGTIQDNGGVLIKALGDAGLFVFPPDAPDQSVTALRHFKQDCDKWLADQDYPDVVSVRAHVGPVAVGMVGAPGAERLDVYGAAVNRAATMAGRNFAVSAPLAERLSGAIRAGLERFGANEYTAD